jgi:hypothetical protein
VNLFLRKYQNFKTPFDAVDVQGNILSVKIYCEVEVFLQTTSSFLTLRKLKLLLREHQFRQNIF